MATVHGHSNRQWMSLSLHRSLPLYPNTYVHASTHCTYVRTIQYAANGNWSTSSTTALPFTVQRCNKVTDVMYDITFTLVLVPHSQDAALYSTRLVSSDTLRTYVRTSHQHCAVCMHTRTKHASCTLSGSTMSASHSSEDLTQLAPWS